MPRSKDPFIIKEVGGDINDREVSGFSYRRFEGTSLGEPGLGSLRRVIAQTLPYILGAGTILIFIVLLGRLIYVQGIKGKYLRDVAEGNRIRLEVITPRRGLIVDRNDKQLAFNTPSFRLVAVPADLPPGEPERQEVLTKVLANVPTELLDQENLSNLSALSYLPRVIAYDLPHELALILMAKVSHYSGLRIEATSERDYTGGAAMGHLLGYLGKISPKEYGEKRSNYQLTDTIGKAGIELSYESLLRGQPGKREVEVDAQGKEHKIYATEPALPGVKLKLTIDSNLQELIYKALKANLGSGSRGGSAVVMNAKNGEILSLVSYPSYEPSLFTTMRQPGKINELLQDKQQPFFNRAIAGQYPPGSTIKPLLAVAALQDGVITPQTTVLSTGGLKLGDQFFADWKPGGHGLVDVYRAIAESVNTFFYTIGGGTTDRAGLGINRIIQYLGKFALAQNLNIDISGERKGFLPTPAWKLEKFKDRWYLGDTYNISIGQGHLLVTPLHMAVAYAALVNGGDLPQPHLLREITYSNGQSILNAPPNPGSINLSPDVLKVVQTAMRQTVTSGSASSLGNLSIQVAGKTGTAQTGPQTAPHAWFAGYAPAQDPEIVVVVMLENSGEGSSVAVPIAREIFNWYGTSKLPN